MKTIFLLLLFVAGVARADAPTTQWTTGASTGQTFLGTYYADKASACSALNSKVSGQVMQSASMWTFTGSIVTGGGDSANQCYLGLIRTDGSGGTSWSGYNYSSKSLCSNGANPDTTKPLAQQCDAPPPSCPSGQSGDVVYSAGTKIPGTNKTTDMKAPSAVGSCSIHPPTLVGCFSVGPSFTEVRCKWHYTYTGSVAGTSGSTASTGQGAADMPANAPPFNPATGQGCPTGTVNMGIDSSGTSICGGSGVGPTTTATPTVTTNPPTTTNNADGSTTKTQVTTQKNSDGSTSTTTTTTTTKADGTETTSSTTATSNNAAGDLGKPDSKDPEKPNDLCKQHPELNICQNSSISGSCEAVSCTGDAIQCAIARQQAKDSCKLKADEDAVKASSYHATGVAALAGTGNSGLPNPANAEQISVGSLDGSGWLGGGNCLADKTITTPVGSFVIPLSKACDALILFRYLFMFVASMISFRILSSSFLGS